MKRALTPIAINDQTRERSRVCCLQVFDLLQIMPQPGGGLGDKFVISRGEQGDFQFAVFEIPPANDGSVYKNRRTDDSGEVEDITHMLPGQEQAFWH